MTSWWLAEEAPPLPSSSFEGRSEVAIVGGGVTGCSCALALAEAGVRVRLHEAREIAGGASGRNGGFALRGAAPGYDEAREQLGVERAQALWRLTERALDRIEELAGDAFRREGSLRLAADVEERGALEAEFDALRADGFAVEWVDELEPPLEGRYFGAIHHPPDGALQPARWVRRLAALAAEAGADIRERSQVHSLDALEGDQIVVATDGYGGSLVPELDGTLWPTRGQVIVTAPLPERIYARPHYGRGGYDYWHQTPDRRLVLGGRRDRAPDLEYSDEEQTTPLIQDELDRFAAELAGASVTIERRWAGIFGMTKDRYPLVGPLPGDDRVWLSTGYSGHGNVMGFACGRLVAESLLGRPDPILEPFDPARALG